MKKLIFLIVFSVLKVSAQESSKYSNEFLNIGVDAQSTGMSNAVVSKYITSITTYRCLKYQESSQVQCVRCFH